MKSFRGAQDQFQVSYGLNSKCVGNVRVYRIQNFYFPAEYRAEIDSRPKQQYGRYSAGNGRKSIFFWLDRKCDFGYLTQRNFQNSHFSGMQSSKQAKMSTLILAEISVEPTIWTPRGVEISVEKNFEKYRSIDLEQLYSLDT